MPILIFLIGTRGSGKSTTLEYLKKRGIETLKPSTTRPKRNEKEQEYFFETELSDGDHAWKIEVGEFYYGMRCSEIERGKDHNIAVTVFDPGNIETLNSFRDSLDLEIVTVGLDTVDHIETLKMRIGSNPERVVNPNEFELHKNAVRQCDVIIQGDETIVGEAVLSVCKLLISRGGLVDDTIMRSMLKAGTLLSGADLGNVQSASYDLRLGTQAWCQGTFVELDEKNPTLKIPPYSYAIVTTQEEARLPRFITGNYDLTVSGFMDGLILSNGPQVDPGYHGSLFCTLFNGADVPNGVMMGQHLATMQFFTTAHVTSGYRGRYQGKSRLREFVSANTAVSPGGNIVTRIDNLERSIDDRIAPVRQFLWSGFIILMTIHLAIAAWLWLGGPKLGEWLKSPKVGGTVESRQTTESTETPSPNNPSLAKTPVNGATKLKIKPK